MYHQQNLKSVICCRACTERNQIFVTVTLWWIWWISC